MLEKSWTFLQASWFDLILLQRASYLKYLDETCHFCVSKWANMIILPTQGSRKVSFVVVVHFPGFSSYNKLFFDIDHAHFAWKCSFSALNNLHKIHCSREIHHYPWSWRNFRTRPKNVAHSLAQLPIEPEIKQLYHVHLFWLWTGVTECRGISGRCRTHMISTHGVTKVSTF